jgi:hypothetical protein
MDCTSATANIDPASSHPFVCDGGSGSERCSMYPISCLRSCGCTNASRSCTSLKNPAEYLHPMQSERCDRSNPAWGKAVPEQDTFNIGCVGLDTHRRGPKALLSARRMDGLRRPRCFAQLAANCAASCGAWSAGLRPHKSSSSRGRAYLHHPIQFRVVCACE